MSDKFGKNNRINILDTIRGICIILMVIYHAMYNLNEIFEIKTILWNTDLLKFLHYFVIGIFLVISGICTSFSRSVLKRGLIIFAAGLVITVFTILFMYENRVIFGILTFIGTMMIIYAPFKKLMEKAPWIIMVLAFILLIVIFRDFSNGTIDLFFAKLEIPQSAYRNEWLIPLGIHGENFVSTDYFPLIPYGFVFLIGTALSKPIKAKKLPNWFYKAKCPPVDFVGRHTLWVYMLHQPVVFGICWFIISKI